MDYLKRSIVPEFVRNAFPNEWIPSSLYLPRASDRKKSDFVLGVYKDRSKEVIIHVFYDWEQESWFANTPTPPFEFDILYWMPLPKTPDAGGAVRR